MLRLLPISLLLVLLAAASAQAATVKVPVPPEGQISVAVASVGKKATVKAKAPAGVAVVGGAKKGKLGVAVAHRRGVVAGGVVTLKVKGTVRGLKTSASAGACKTLSALLSKPLQGAGVAAADLRALGAATAARACGKPFSPGRVRPPGPRRGAADERRHRHASPVSARRWWRRRRRRPTSARTGSTTTATARSTLRASASCAPTPAA